MEDDKSTASFASVAKFSFKDVEQSVKVVKVVDGDTVFIVADYNGELVNLKCRLKGIDCAELKPGSLDVEGRNGWSARDFLAHLCTGGSPKTFNDTQRQLSKQELEQKLSGSRSLVYAILGDFDCFGRVLVTLKYERSVKKSFSEILEDYGYAKDKREKAPSRRSFFIR